jgi:CHAT domain-containing protein
MRYPWLFAAVLSFAQAGVQAPRTADQSWQALDARVEQLYEQGDLTRAIEAARAALAVSASPYESGRSLDRLGFLYYTSGNLADGEKYLRESLETRQAAFGPDSLESTETENDLAMLLRDVRHMDDAKKYAEHAVAMRERLLGSTALPVAESLNTLGTVLGLSGDYSGAVTRFERALAIHESRPATERASEEYGTLCVNLAGTYQRLGKYDAAEATFRKGLDVLRVAPGLDHPAYATSELAYASLEVDLGHYADAERLYDEGGRLVERELGDKHPIYATFLNNRGLFYQSIGNVAAAEADYRHSLDLKRTLYGPGNPLAVSTLRNLAHLTYRRDHRGGEQLLSEAVDAYGRMPQAPPFDFASVLVGLADAERDRGALEEARATITKAIEISRRGLGERHPLYASAMRELGLVLAAEGRSDEAGRQLRSALAVAEDVHGPDHPDVATFLDALGDFYTSRHDYSSALTAYTRSVEIQDRFASDVLEIGSESFKTASLAAASDLIPRLIAFQTAAATTLPAARVLAFDAVTRRKGQVVTQVGSWRQRLQDTSSDQIRREAAEWQAVVECRTSLTVALGYHDLKPAVAGSCTLHGTPLEGRYERLLSDLRSRWTADIAAETVRAIGALQARADELEASLNRKTGGASRVSRTSTEELRRQLEPDEALIEFVAYNDGTRRYGAFVLTSSGPLDFADVGPGAPIDTAVNDLLTAARDWSVSIAHGERTAAQESRRTAHTALADLSTLVWRPVKPLIDARPDVRRLRIAPDASLNLVPFDALSDGRDLIDRFAIAYVPAGRDLVVAPPAAVPSGAVVVVSPGDSELAHLSSARGEASDVVKVVNGAVMYTGTNATEAHVKQLQHPALLHIVGHGVIRDTLDCKTATCAAGLLDPSTRAMSLAAVVLEEAYGRGGASTDDGLLTALELENMDLHGTEMLVLSQCQMASGVTSVGEGVYGMRRAALVAGVRTFVAPLWNIEDSVQRTLMKDFYEGVAAGRTRADAMRSAKLAVRRTPATSDFLYWAPEILSGSPGALPASLFRR